MTTAALRSCVIAAAEAVEANRDELCRLDAAAGDGDHGLTMALAARAVRQALAASPDAAGPELLADVALAMSSVGGAAGPIYSAGLLAIVDVLRRSSAERSLTVAQLLVCAEAAESAISALGHAKPGDKTILDALDPAVRALRQAQTSDADIRDALKAATAAAREGAASSAELIATVGRASRLGERSRGLADPGASSLALIIEASAASYLRESG
ncbi:MAG TPA: dihydroxyacetone kinase subunit DhaL [Dongiaceae bacterium]